MITQAARGHMPGAGEEQKATASLMRDDKGWGATEGKEWIQEALEGSTHRAW